MHKHIILTLALILAACTTPPHEVAMPANGTWSEPAFVEATKTLNEADTNTLAAFMVRYEGARRTAAPLEMPATIGETLQVQRAHEQAEAAEAARVAAEKEAQEARIKTAVSTRLISKKMVKLRYEQYQAFELELSNNLDVEIKGVSGYLAFVDMFGKTIKEINVSYDEPLAPKTPVRWEAAMRFNEFIDDHRALAAADAEKLTVLFHPEIVLLADGTRLEVSK